MKASHEVDQMQKTPHEIGEGIVDKWDIVIRTGISSRLNSKVMWYFGGRIPTSTKVS